MGKESTWYELGSRWVIVHLIFTASMFRIRRIEAVVAIYAICEPSNSGSDIMIKKKPNSSFSNCLRSKNRNCQLKNQN